MTIDRETERVPQENPWGQGDVVRVEWPDGETGPQFGAVINADCDLEHGKIDGVIAFLPIYRFHDYLAEFWAKGHNREVCRSASQAALKLAGDSDEAALHTWLSTTEATAVASSIAKYKKLKVANATKLERHLERLSICLDTERTEIAKFRDICRSDPKPETYARAQINSAKKSMGESHFLISDIVDDPSVGFVIRMRRIYTILEEYCFKSKREQMSKSQGNSPTAVRVARLTERYRFKVLQLFSQQYSRIGLPDEMTELGDLVVDDLVANFAGDQI